MTPKSEQAIVRGSGYVRAIVRGPGYVRAIVRGSGYVRAIVSQGVWLCQTKQLDIDVFMGN